MKQLRSILFFFRSPAAGYKRWYLLAFIGLISLTAFRSGTDVSKIDYISYKLPDSLTQIDHSFTQELLKKYRERQRADSLVNLALQLQGIPYRWGGTSPKGFDCSGFVSYVYERFGHPLSRTSRSQSREGRLIFPEEVQKGDLLFFTGTNANIRQVGHVGIVVSAEDDILFVHSSSSGGVKVSELQGYYQSRLIAARRMLQAD